LTILGFLGIFGDINESQRAKGEKSQILLYNNLLPRFYCGGILKLLCCDPAKDDLCIDFVFSIILYGFLSPKKNYFYKIGNILF